MADNRIKLDHLVVAAATLEDGTAWVRRQLHVDVPRGGRHLRMGTHNCVGRTGKGVYLEVIAPDPDAGPLARTPWFSFGSRAFLDDLRANGPRIAHWVVRTTSIEETLSAAIVDAGPAIDMERDDLRWRVTVRDDGLLLEYGLYPTVIEWEAATHPSSRMTDLGIELDSLTLSHPDPDRLRAALRAIGADDCVTIAKSDGGFAIAAAYRHGSRGLRLG